MYRGMVNSNPLVVVASAKFAFAIEISSGMTRWAYALKGAGFCRVVIMNDKVYIAGAGELACIEYATGKELFHVSTYLDADVTLMIDGDHIFVGASGKVACYDQFGKRLWTNNLDTEAGIGFAVPGMAEQIDT